MEHKRPRSFSYRVQHPGPKKFHILLSCAQAVVLFEITATKQSRVLSRIERLVSRLIGRIDAIRRYVQQNSVSEGMAIVVDHVEPVIEPCNVISERLWQRVTDRTIATTQSDPSIR